MIDKIPKGSDGDVYKFVKFTGQIEKGDARKLANFITKNYEWIETINLYSAGGDLNEAIMMGEIIRASRIDTVVQPGAICASACFFIWINGPDRVMFSNPPPNKKTGLVNPSKIGLHRPYLKSITNTDKSISKQEYIMQATIKYLQKRMVPNRLIEIMMGRGSNDIYWINYDDQIELGFTPHELEELYISHCNDNRKTLYREISIAREEGNTSLETGLMARLAKIRACIDNLNYEARSKAVASGFNSILEGIF